MTGIYYWRRINQFVSAIWEREMRKEDEYGISKVPASFGTEDTNSLSTIPVPVQQPASEGYKQVCGQADVWGDGVVPEVSAHLEGALNISLDGVYHSPVGLDDESRPWYGSPSVVDKWLNHLLH
ncbi:hypothetical protein POM88_024131 [Heracleum sosnowskyi]|uniref:Uncharacterized protein n=1 Tax=Heracleum sosnowskyi TaxID=360622 RepID=A0AAD8IK50_9APIA|nr:hypothetical protein POM88_024131 [Heracleum sosnowskyi]